MPNYFLAGSATYETADCRFLHFSFGVNLVKGPVCRLGQTHRSLRKHMQTDKTRAKI